MLTEKVFHIVLDDLPFVRSSFALFLFISLVSFVSFLFCSLCYAVFSTGTFLLTSKCTQAEYVPPILVGTATCGIHAVVRPERT